MYPNYQWDSPEEEARYSVWPPQQPNPSADVPWTPGLVADLGDQEAENPFLPPPPAFNPNAPVPPTAPQPPLMTPQGGGEGPENDARLGLFGGYYGSDGRWVRGEPRQQGSIDPTGNGLTSGSAILPNQGFQWPTYNAPRVSFGEFPGFNPFKPPSMEEILADPVLQAQLTEGNQRIKGDRAFRGTLRSGSTLKDIFDWTSDRVKLGANDAFERSFKVYDVNERQNPFNTWSANRDLAFGTFDRNAPQSRDEFLFNQYEPAKSQFQQNYDVWAKQGDWTRDVALGGEDR